MSKKKPTRQSTPQQARAAGWKDPLQPQQPLVSGKWLLTAIGVVIALAAVSAYVAFCLLFYQGSWQLLYHPSHAIHQTPASIGLPFEDVHFHYSETGQSQLNGWWIPAGPDAAYPDHTMLLLHDGKGSLSDIVGQLQALHALGINIFAFDYRGFGHSADTHPSEKKMSEDTDAAWAYLTGIRHVPAHSIVIYGTGIGANLAATAAVRHPESPALVLENLSPDALTLLASDSRSHLVPVRLLTEDRLDARSALSPLKTPKLFLERGSSPSTEALFPVAAYPRELFQFSLSDQSKYLETLRRFLDEQLSHP